MIECYHVSDLKVTIYTSYVNMPCRYGPQCTQGHWFVLLLPPWQKEAMFLGVSVCLSVCLWATLLEKFQTNYDWRVRGGNINKWLNCGGDLGLLRWVKFFCVKNKWLTNVLYFTPYRLSPVYLNHKHTSEIPTRYHLLGIQTSSTLLLIKSLLFL